MKSAGILTATVLVTGILLVGPNMWAAAGNV